MFGFASMHAEPRFAGTKWPALSAHGRPHMRKGANSRARATGRRGFPCEMGFPRCGCSYCRRPPGRMGPSFDSPPSHLRCAWMSVLTSASLCTLTSVCRPLSLPARPLSAALEGSSWLPHSPLPLPAPGLSLPPGSNPGGGKGRPWKREGERWGPVSTQGVLSALPRS